MSNGNRPAYPTIISVNDYTNAITHGMHVDGGLTKREQFAMAAMQGLLGGGSTLCEADMALCAVVAADALLAALEQQS